MPLPTSYIYAPASNFSEAVLSDNGNWIGGLVGQEWNTPKVLNGVICASVENTDSRDPIAHLNPANFSLGSDYYIACTVRRAAGYVPSDGHEVEVHFSSSITPGSAKLIENTFQFLDDASSQNVQPFIWNGAFGELDFTTLGGTTITNGSQIRDGDILAGRKAGNNYFLYHNDVQIATYNVNVPAGMPGIGFFMRPNGIPQNYGFVKVAVTAGANTVFVPSQVYSANTRAFPIANIDQNLSLFQMTMSRESWPVNAVLTVGIEVAQDGVNFKPVGGGTLAGGDLVFKGRPVTHSRITCGIPGKGTTGRAARITFQNSTSLRTAVNGFMF